ncbi:gamma-glutamylcyclotransferase family protein [Croceicoccus estronivorus]|uniref:gamma-glutamylcyclotransferase family protein n=1 Tax=Croceicoccus estronivorus TaxID=1172626 RepID=UPI00147808FF|nr:gamma-glutamylcyclotransferase family protein [Croceicoccus estronivorus]
MNRPFFFYGTLQQDLATGEAARLVAALGPGVPASVRAALFAIDDPNGSYPVLVHGAARQVKGRLVFGPEDRRWLARMDAYEGAEYRRCPVRAMTSDGKIVRAEAYIYTRRRGAGLIPVPHGDFARFLAETGRRPLQR